MNSSDTLIDTFDLLIRRDPARRGLISTEAQFGPLCAGHLFDAAAHIAEYGRRVAIVTGFFVPHAQIAAAETDGPPGALLLASALAHLGIQTSIVTDERCASAVRSAAIPFDQTFEIAVIPSGAENAGQLVCSAGGQTLTHLMAVERVGPSHTLDSLKAQKRTGPPPVDDFLARVPPECHNRCYNMRGMPIDEYSAEMHRLFEQASIHTPDIKTIGIGDGANEIGMGAIPWEELARRIEGEQAPRIPCRIATDWNIVAGTSNWGAMALAAALLVLRQQTEFLRPFDRQHHLHVLEEMVRHGPAVDGVTGLQEPTVDGLPFLTYIQPWEGIRRLLGFDGI